MPALPIDRRKVLLRRLAWCCAVLVLAVTSLSAYIRQAGAGLGCQPWPQCQTKALQAAQSGAAVNDEVKAATALARLLHRVVASAALLLALMLVMVSLAVRPVLRREAGWSLLLLGLALGLSVLGIWSSGARVPAVTLGNLLGGFAMLAVCVRLALAGRGAANLGLRGWALAATVLLVCQVALGGLVSATFSGSSCTATSDCNLMQALAQPGAWRALDPWRDPAQDLAQTELPRTDSAAVLLHSLHRHAAAVLAVALLALAGLAWRRRRRTAAWVLLALLLAQLGVGWGMVALLLPLWGALLHNALAAALLATLVMLI